MAAGAGLCEGSCGSIALLGGSVERPRLRILILATLIISFWNLMSGTVVVMALSASCIGPCAISWPFESADRLVRD
jgi:hypothetical protein